jgi:hypothetical protein
MAQVTISEDALRQMLKQALADALDERRDLLRDVIAEVLEDFALAEAIREGEKTEHVSRDEIFAELGDSS